MKKYLKIYILMLALFAISLLSAQQKEPKFEIKFFNDRSSIGLICDKGCTWTNLFIKNNSFYLNQFGMVNINVADEVNKSDFIFSVKKKDNKLYLKALKGLSWKELSFKLPKDKNNSVIVSETKIQVE